MFENFRLPCDASRVSLNALDRSNGLPNMLLTGDIIKFPADPALCTRSLPNGRCIVYISACINDEDTWLPLSVFKRYPDKVEELESFFKLSPVSRKFISLSDYELANTLAGKSLCVTGLKAVSRKRWVNGVPTSDYDTRNLPCFAFAK